MAFEGYMTVEGTKQGKFKGESPRTAHKDSQTVLGFEYEVISPRDVATGQASGKRQHKPITICKEWGAASPQFFQACATNEVLKSVLFEFVKTTKDAKEYVYYTVKLTNATVSTYKMHSGKDAKHEDEYSTLELDEISFTFQKIEVTNTDAKTTAADDWVAS